jgi:hypothetical protein
MAARITSGSLLHVIDILNIEKFTESVELSPPNLNLAFVRQSQQKTAIGHMLRVNYFACSRKGDNYV